MKIKLLFITAISLLCCACGVSNTDRENFGQQCKKWMAEDFSTGYRTAADINIGDAWTKNGKLVFEMLIPDTDGSSSSVLYCVVDREKGTMLKPSVFEMSSWSK